MENDEAGRCMDSKSVEAYLAAVGESREVMGKIIERYKADGRSREWSFHRITSLVFMATSIPEVVIDQLEQFTRLWPKGER